MLGSETASRGSRSDRAVARSSEKFGDKLLDKVAYAWN